MIYYLIETVICLLVMLIAYRLMLAKTSLHQIKRCFLLACIVLPLLWPLANIQIYYDAESPKVNHLPGDIQTPLSYLTGDETGHNLGSVILTSPLPEMEESMTSSYFNWVEALWAIYLTITALFVMRLLIQMRKIRRLAQNSEQERHRGYRLVLLDKVASPYSFFRYIFMGKSEYKDPMIKQQLLTHELVHVREWHSIDVLLIELSKAVFWFNPMYWLLAKNIRLNHEFIADAGVIAKTQNRQSYQNTLLNFYQQPRVNSPLVSPSDYSFIKSRFQMMQKSTPKKTAVVRLLLLIPVLGGILFSIAMDLKPRPVEADVLKTETSTLAPSGIPVASVKKQARMLGKPNSKAQREAMEFTDEYPGVDITSAPGLTVVATGDGKVEEVGKADEKYGNYLLISHNEEFKTLYASLEEIKVSVGAPIKAGQILGSIGTSMKENRLPIIVDRVHYAISKNGKWVNPYDYFDLPIEEIKTATAENGKPNILPFDTDNGEFMVFRGFIPGSTPKITSLYDTAIGAEFFSLPATLIHTTGSGMVTEVVKGHEWYGNYVKVRHNEVYETLYAKLDEVTVQKGQQLTKGQNIGRVGTVQDMYGRVHYKLIENGKSGWLSSQLFRKMSQGPGPIYVRPVNPADNQYGMLEGYIPWALPNGFLFKNIFFDRDKAVFVKASGETITKKATELSEGQKGALLSLRAKPVGTQIRQRPVPEEVYSRWEKPWVYKIHIDGEYIESKEMVNYKPEDFAHSSWVVVSKKVKEKYGYAFELSLWTEDYYKQYQENSKKEYREWRAATKETLSIFKDL